MFFIKRQNHIEVYPMTAIAATTTTSKSRMALHLKKIDH
jgi:hypothetical protein